MERDLKIRTKKFALEIIKIVSELPKNSAGFELGKQLIRSGTSIGANYRSALRGRSRAEFISKLSIVQEEADETVFWLELIEESELINPEKIRPLVKEANELTAFLPRWSLIPRKIHSTLTFMIHSIFNLYTSFIKPSPFSFHPSYLSLHTS
ncbi:four helix bundle protein [Algoriphagus namhaensis]|uniref:Four helix bundle protein n=1 Tax=Algoriphagus namhaensis TaxID=915353 RepID=A0ABV8APA6_9BACT